MIAPRVPAKTCLPAWFKKLPAVYKAVFSANGSGQTIKRRMPFLELPLLLLLGDADRLGTDVDGGHDVAPELPEAASVAEAGRA